MDKLSEGDNAFNTHTQLYLFFSGPSSYMKYFCFNRATKHNDVLTNTPLMNYINCHRESFIDRAIKAVSPAVMTCACQRISFRHILSRCTTKDATHCTHSSIIVYL